MSNDYFRFMRFTVRQNRTAMKVGTDGVLLGAWCGTDGTARALDAGTGTGLIALMIAQRCGAVIDAVEIDDDAFIQARDNFDSSPWKDRITAHHSSFQSFSRITRTPYDLIVSNPPYFSNSLLPESEGRTLARHSGSLPLDEFFPCAADILAPDGRIALILPYTSAGLAVQTARNAGLTPCRRRDIRTRADRDYFRVLFEFSAEDRPCTEEIPLTIESGAPGTYTADYRALTGDFYLFGRSV